MLEKWLSKNFLNQKAWFYIRPETNDKDIIDDVRYKNGYFSCGMGDLNNNDIVVDIGGHIGSFAIECVIRTNANVISFEPEPENYEIFKSNIELNNLGNKITLHNKAISLDGKMTYLYMDDVNPGSHSLIKDCVDHKGANKVEVETVTLDTITKDLGRVKLLKLDCEGLEYDILMWSDLSKVEKIVAELHNKEKTPALMDYLMVKGFFIKWHYGKRLGRLQAKR